jgi:NAD(P)-dependent dehydrogenase (short-subunit alcohol dehydrogenase family)
VTGANSGTGYEASKALALKNAEVVMACRNLERGRIAAETIKNEIPSALIHVMKLDLADLSSIKSFTEEFRSKNDRLDILLNNAGIMQTPEKLRVLEL